MNPNAANEIPMEPTGLPSLTSWQWSDVLDELYAHATRLWEHDREELADALAELADALARQAWIASGIDIEDDMHAELEEAGDDAEQ
ncbi:MAG: hypothetical protein GEU93_19530 [Propionibacteriales bacterium]|nr:hypothetical protein [Propionibacteriales bacterium]